MVKCRTCGIGGNTEFLLPNFAFCHNWSNRMRFSYFVFRILVFWFVASGVRLAALTMPVVSCAKSSVSSALMKLLILQLLAVGGGVVRSGIVVWSVSANIPNSNCDLLRILMKPLCTVAKRKMFFLWFRPS